MWLGLILFSLGAALLQIGKRQIGILWRLFGLVCLIFVPIDIFSWVYEVNKTGNWVWGKAATGFHLIVDVFLICITLGSTVFLTRKGLTNGTK